MSKKTFVHLLLALCIGFLPVLDAVAATAAQAFTMPMDGTDCDPPAAHAGDSCPHEQCPSMFAACGAQVGGGLPGRYFEVRADSPAQEAPASRDSPRQRPDIDESLYRPPIA